jgi:hypothetical protein
MRNSSAYMFSAERSLRQRVIALAAAYVIALSGLIASFTVASAVAGDIANPTGVICHNEGAGQQAPSPADHDKLCVDCCTTGCMMLMAALPPPPAIAAAYVPSARTVDHPLTRAVLVNAPQTRSHRSRAPPRAA